MNSYYSMLLHVADKRKSSVVIDNDTIDDTADVYNRFFLSAKEKITIVSRGVKDDVLAQAHVLDSSARYLSDPSRKLEFVLRARNQSDAQRILGTDFMTHVRRSADGNKNVEVKFYQGDDEWLPDVGSTTIGDGRMYRYRYKQEDYSNSCAKVCFNDVDRCKQLMEKVRKSIGNTMPIVERKF